MSNKNIVIDDQNGNETQLTIAQYRGVNLELIISDSNDDYQQFEITAQELLSHLAELLA